MKDKKEPKDRKKFKETKVGQFFGKAVDVVKENKMDLIELGVAAATMNPAGVMENLGDILRKEKTPEAAALVTELDVQREEFEKELFSLEIQDRDSARKMQIAALQQDSWLAKHFMYLLAAFIILSATAIGIMMFFVEFPDENRRLIEMFADIYLFAGALMVLQFFFGSSKGSSDKNHIISQAKSILS